MPADFKRIKDIFLAAVEQTDPPEREAYLRRACGDDAALRRRVEMLLGRHAQTGIFLEQPAFDAAAMLAPPSAGTDDPAPQQEVAGTRLGPYKLLQKIGEGGMGAVWLAEQQEPVRRLVALKVIRVGVDSGQGVARFEAERQALALMDHPNIAKILDGGTTADGRPYFVMELVKGTPITHYCDEHRLTPRQRLELFVPVCRALQHAHQKGIIHRDLKPSNVMVAPYDGRPVVKVIDFGVAKAAGQRLTERTLFTEFGMVVGTLEYMSPEQAELNNQDIDTRSDVYSLGVLLYELLTGTTPLTAERLKKSAFLEMLRAIREEEPPRPSTRLSDSKEAPSISAQRQTEPAQLRKLLRGELDWIVMKALEKDRGRRYDTASALALDVERHLNDETVEACPPSPGYRVRKFLRRYKGPVVAATGILVALVLGLVGTTVFALRARDSAQQADVDRNKALAEQQRADREADAARAEQQRADREADAAWANQYIAHMNRVESDWEHGNISRVLDTLALYRKPPPERKDPRGWEWHYQDRLCHPELRTLKGHTAVVCNVVFSPDGTRLASASHDKTVKLWDAASGQELRTLQGHTNLVQSVAFSPDGKRVASGAWDNTVKLWDAASGQELRSLQGHTDWVQSVAFSPDGTRLASASQDGTVKLWDAASGQELRSLQAHNGALQSVVFSPDGKRVASCGSGLAVKLWDADSGQEFHTLKGHTNAVQSVVFSPDGTRLASGGWDGTVRLWDAASGQELRSLTGHTGGVNSVAFTPDGTRLASAGEDQTVKLWDAVSGQELRTLRSHARVVQSVVFSPDGTRLASASNDQTVKLWDAASGQELRSLKGHTNMVNSVAFSPDGTRLASGSWDATAKLWDAASGQELRSLKGHTGPLQIVVFSPDGTRLATGSWDATAKLWDAASGQELHSLKNDTGLVHSVAFSPDGKRVASASHDGTVTLWDAASGQELRSLKGHTEVVHSVVFSPDGTRLASSSHDGTVRLWDAASGRELRTFQGHTGVVWSVAFSPDGKRVASSGNDQTVKLWDVVSGQELRSLRGHTGPVQSVVFSPDGTRLASASFDQTVRLWDAASGQELRSLQGHTGPVQSVVFSPDGTRLASSGQYLTVKLWDARPLTPEVQAEVEAVALLEALFSRPLSRTEVCAILKKQVTLSEAVRKQALELADRFREETDPQKYLAAAWPVVRHPHANVFMCEFAVAQMKAACRLDPDLTTFRRALGVAQYRLGRFRQVEYSNALATLLKGDRNDPTTLAFLAMSQYQDGQKEQARSTLARVRELSSKPPWSSNAETAAFLREAAALIEDKPALPRP